MGKPSSTRPNCSAGRLPSLAPPYLQACRFQVSIEISGAAGDGRRIEPNGLINALLAALFEPVRYSLTGRRGGQAVVLLGLPLECAIQIVRQGNTDVALV